MDVGFRSALVDAFRRGEVAKDVRMMAARGALAPRAHEQVALLALLTSDADSEVQTAAEATIASIPAATLAQFLGRTDVSEPLREFFRARGIEPAAGSEETDTPLIDAEEGERQSTSQELALLGVADRMKAAMKGTREERAVLIRDPNRLVSSAVLSSPKLTEAEVESFAKMANVSEEVLRVIGMNRAWAKNYGIVSALVRNPKTPLGVSLNFVQRLNDRDLKAIAMDRNLQEPLKLAVRKRLVSGEKR